MDGGEGGLEVDDAPDCGVDICVDWDELFVVDAFVWVKLSG